MSGTPPTVYRALDFPVEQGLVHKIERFNPFVVCRHGTSRAPAEPAPARRGFAPASAVGEALHPRIDNVFVAAGHNMIGMSIHPARVLLG